MTITERLANLLEAERKRIRERVKELPWLQAHGVVLEKMVLEAITPSDKRTPDVHISSGDKGGE